MRILIATPLLPSQPGGPAQYAVGLTQALKSKGHQIDVIAFQDVARYPSGIRHIILFLKALTRVKKVDAVIVLDTFSMALPVLVATFLLRKKSIVRAGGDFVWEQYVERTKEKVLLSGFYKADVHLSVKERFVVWLQRNIVVPLADVLVFSTAWQRDIWSAPYHLLGKHVVVIENAYLLPRPAVSLKSNSRRVVWIGRNIALKNLDTLDRAIELVRATVPSLEYEKHLAVPHGGVAKILGESRMLVVPSLSEVSPNLVFEALALQVPVLLTRDCGIKKVFQGAIMWIDPLSASDIAQCISTLMTDAGYREAKERVRSLHNTRTYHHVAGEFLKLLQ